MSSVHVHQTQFLNYHISKIISTFCASQVNVDILLLISKVFDCYVCVGNVNVGNLENNKLKKRFKKVRIVYRMKFDKAK